MGEERILQMMASLCSGSTYDSSLDALPIPSKDYAKTTFSFKVSYEHRQ